MKKSIEELIQRTEKKIINILVGAYNSGKIDETEKFTEYELEEIKKSLFMRSELEDMLYELEEGDEYEIN